MTSRAGEREAWERQLRATKQWLDQRDEARTAGPIPPRPVSCEVAALYLEFATRQRYGPVLDIGCGRGTRRHHFPAGYIGLDAVAEWDEGKFPFVQGMAENLPWPDATFEAVLSVEAFDHFLDPPLAATEALRVLQPGGELLVFVGTGVPADPVEAGAHTHTFSQGELLGLFRTGLRSYRVARDRTYLALLGERGAGTPGGEVPVSTERR
jgi:SAM-dependent methyltransferase